MGNSDAGKTNFSFCLVFLQSQYIHTVLGFGGIWLVFLLVSGDWAFLLLLLSAPATAVESLLFRLDAGTCTLLYFSL